MSDKKTCERQNSERQKSSERLVKTEGPSRLNVDPAHRTTEPKKPCDFVFGTEVGWGWGGVYPRILGSNQVLSDSLGSEPKTRENNSKPKGTNMKR